MLATVERRMPRSEVEALVRDVLRQRLTRPSARLAKDEPRLLTPRVTSARPRPGSGPNPLVVNVSARHMHVTPADLETLFGRGATLTKQRDLYQEGEFASEQLVTLVGPRQRIIPNVRILGPVRNYTQVELSYTDGVYLGVDLPLPTSGDHGGTPGGPSPAPQGHGRIN